MSNWVPNTQCSKDGCRESATVHVAVVNMRQLVIDRFCCDRHGEECVHRSGDTTWVGMEPLQSVDGAVCCDVRLILSRPVVVGDEQYVHLREVNGNRWLGFYCGFIEAAVMLSSIAVPSPTRPFMHDVLCGTVSAVGGSIQYVHIHDHVATGSYYLAKLAISAGGESVFVDARPSDAVSLAIRSGKPIFVAAQLLSVP